ncbi:unnamed protein product [Closterium sp. Naga37s-1]|nr:unnamed protein product [Closterium sp. Naga37s-1]
MEDDKQLAFFEALRKRQVESFNQQEEVARQLRIQAERDEVARIGWKRAAKKLLGRLRGSQWDPLPGADVDFADFWALLQMGRVKFVNYGDNGRFVEVILPHPAKDLGLEVTRGEGARKKGNQAARQAAPKAAEGAAAGEAGEVAGEEAEAVGHMGLPDQGRGEEAGEEAEALGHMGLPEQVILQLTASAAAELFGRPITGCATCQQTCIQKSGPPLPPSSLSAPPPLLLAPPLGVCATPFPSLSGRVVEAQGAAHASRRAFRALVPPPLTLCPSLRTSLDSLLSIPPCVLRAVPPLPSGRVVEAQGSTVGTIQLAATWGMRLALASGLYVGLERVLFPLYQPTKLEERPRSSHRKLTAVLNPDLGTMGQSRVGEGACGLYVGLERVLFPLYQPTKLEERSRSSHRKLTAVLNPDLGTMGQSRARYISAEEKTGITFDDFAGQDYVKRELQEVVRILRAAKEFEDLGVYCPKGVLLFGPPGTGKTLLAKAIAGEAGVPFFSVSGAEFVEMFAGVAASRVKDLFFRARQFAPAIIFIDEIDAIGSLSASWPHPLSSLLLFHPPDVCRSSSLKSERPGNIEREQGLIQILTELDGFQENQAKVLVIGATNRLDMLDPALLRKGRFDTVLVIGATNRLDMLDPALLRKGRLMQCTRPPLRKGRFDKVVLVIGATNRLGMLDPALLRCMHASPLCHPPPSHLPFSTHSPPLQVLVIGATNRLDMLDPALLRKGRFDKVVRVGLPTEEGRFSVLKFDKVVRVGLPTEEGRFSVLKGCFALFYAFLKQGAVRQGGARGSGLPTEEGRFSVLKEKAVPWLVSARWCAWGCHGGGTVLPRLSPLLPLSTPSHRLPSPCSPYYCFPYIPTVAFPVKVHARNKAFKPEEEKLKLSPPLPPPPPPCPSLIFCQLYPRYSAATSAAGPGLRMLFLRKIAAATPDYSGAELMNILNEAAILAIRKDKDEIEREELLQAIDRQAGEFKTGEEDVLDSREVRMRAAYREASIAVLECALPDRSGPIKRTSLDNVDPLPNMEHERVRHRCFAVKQDMLDAIVRAFAPAIMERMVFGAANVSWQAGVAYREAVQLADYVILRSGMSALGKVVYETQKDLMPHLIPKVIALREEYMRYSKAKCEAVLKEYRSAVDTIAERLLEEGEVTGDAIHRIYDAAPKFPQPPVRPIDEYAVLVHNGSPQCDLSMSMQCWSTRAVRPIDEYAVLVHQGSPQCDLSMMRPIDEYAVLVHQGSPQCDLSMMRPIDEYAVLAHQGSPQCDLSMSMQCWSTRAVRPIDEYAVLVHQGRWGIHGASLPGRATFHPGHSGYATFGAPRPQQVQAVSDETWRVVEGMWRERIAELRQMDEEDEEEREQQLLLPDLVLPQQVQAVSDETWRVVEGMWREKIAELRQMDEEDEEEREQQLLLPDLVL